MPDAFEAAAERQRRGVRSDRTPGATTAILEHYLPHMAQALLGLPERATRAAGELQATGDQYDPGPALEAALLTMGATPFSAPRGAVGAGPTRLGNPAPETIRGAAIRSREGQVFEGATHGDAATNLFRAKHQLDPAEAGDGFVTSTGRFVNRDEATKIALREKQTYDPEFVSNRGTEAQIHARDLRPLNGGPKGVDARMQMPTRTLLGF